MTRRACVIALVATLGGAAGLAAQRSAIVAGHVSDAEAHQPIGYAEVHLIGTLRVALTDSTGAFRLTGVPSGPRSLLVRAFGYRPVRIDLSLEAGDSLLLGAGILALQPLAIELPAVVARSDSSQVPALVLAGFYERRRRGFGSFAEADQIHRWHPLAISDVLRHLPGVHIVVNPNYGRTRGRADFRPYLIELRGCRNILFYLNGVSLGSSADPQFNLELVADPQDVTAVEVYHGPSEIPLQFNATNSLCGAVILWTER